MSKPQEVQIINPCLHICATYRHRLRDRYDTAKASLDSGLLCQDPSKAVQSQKEESDINTIVRRFGLTGQLPSNVRMPQYGDFTGITTYQDALNAVLEAQASFQALPAHIRERFGHDPEKFVEFCFDENNRAEAEKLGLVLKKAPVEKGAVPATGSTGQPETPKVEVKA